MHRQPVTYLTKKIVCYYRLLTSSTYYTLVSILGYLVLLEPKLLVHQWTEVFHVGLPRGRMGKFSPATWCPRSPHCRHLILFCCVVDCFFETDVFGLNSSPIRCSVVLTLQPYGTYGKRLCTNSHVIRRGQGETIVLLVFWPVSSALHTSDRHKKNRLITVILSLLVLRSCRTLSYTLLTRVTPYLSLSM